MSRKYSANSTEEERKKAKEYLESLAEKNVSRDIVIQRYDQSSETYVASMVVLNYSAPKETAATVAQLFPSNRENIFILDVAAGTGLCAIELRKHGFLKMDAFDASPHMLNEAKKRNLYGRYICDMLGENSLDIEDNTYDAVTICGMSIEIMAALPLKAFEELIRVVKPGGYIINTHFHTTFADDNIPTEDFRRNMKTLEFQGKWKAIEIRKFEGFLHGRDGGVSLHRVC